MRAETFIVSVITSLLFCFDFSLNIKVIPQKANITYLNPKYIEWANLTVKRYGRKSDYYLNLEGKKYHVWDNNITIHLIFNEYLHNEYRRSFVEMHFQLCNLLNNEATIGAMFRSYKLKCPVIQNEYHFMNMTVPTKDLNFQLPFEKSRVDCVINIAGTEERVADGHLYVLFKP